MALKASIGIFLLRICVTKTHKIVIWAITGVTELYSLFFFLLFVLQCRPTSLFWLRYTADPPNGSCMDAQVVSNAFYGYSAISCLSDWTYSILPIFLVWKLQMSLRTKVSVVLILAAGAMYGYHSGCILRLISNVSLQCFERNYYPIPLHLLLDRHRRLPIFYFRRRYLVHR